MSIEKDMEKYDCAEALEKRSALDQMQATISRLQYELYCMNNYYQKQLSDYQVYIGVKKKEEKDNV